MKLRFLEPAVEGRLKPRPTMMDSLRVWAQCLNRQCVLLLAILKYPEAWQPLSNRTRACRLRRFPYNIIYCLRAQEVLIIAVAHQHRRPEYWKGRLG